METTVSTVLEKIIDDEPITANEGILHNEEGIDCSPSLGMLTINALTCYDEVIIPVQAQYLSIKGMEQLLRTIGRVRKQLNPNLQISGILIPMADRTSSLCFTILMAVKLRLLTALFLFR